MSNKNYKKRKTQRRIEKREVLEKDRTAMIRKERIRAIIVVTVLALAVAGTAGWYFFYYKGTSTTQSLPASEDEFKLLPNSSFWSDGKKIVINYLAREGCPYSATESWSLFLALSNYGNFSDISYLHSNVKDYNDTAGINYMTTKYSSNEIVLNVTYVSAYYDYNLNGWVWFQKPNGTLTHLWYSLNPQNISPLLIIGGKYESLRFPFSPPSSLQDVNGTSVMTKLMTSSITIFSNLRELATNISAVISLVLNASTANGASQHSFVYLINSLQLELYANGNRDL